MHVDVAVRAAAADGLIQLPAQGHLRVRQPVLGVARVIMANLAQRALGDDLPGLRDGRQSAAGVANHVDDLRLLGCRQHGFGLLDIEGQRLFAQHMLAGPAGGDGNFGMRVVVSVDINGVNQRRLDHLAPVCRGELPAQFGARGLHAGGVAPAECVHFDSGFQRENEGRLAPCIGVGFSRAPIADHPDP